ncbi:hypothetical protein [Proteiniphilum sp. X52]|uniref:hypothetical protein n=1 Tax=Proteiniphilum sp. X52 TaxID=2382159 RepID=UPI000F09C619|nr:hypothetical protein [Proteiniphilum sp. X52]RNC65184.1 hypothetical protein D7D25_08450 [Proteiniphilum sp. X52]
MKKVILFLSVIGATLLMTSCLGETSNSYTDSSYVYIDTDDRGEVYAKTFTGRIITHSALISGLNEIQLLVYSWDEEKGTTPLTFGQNVVYADNVNIIQKKDDIYHTTLRMSPLPEEEDPAGFDEIGTPLFTSDRAFMDDYWVLEYAYKANKGQKAKVEFYKEAALNDKGEVVIKIQLTLSGTTDATSQEQQTDVVAFKMSALRDMYSGGSEGKEELKVLFKYNKREANGEVKEAELPVVSWKIKESN